MSARHARRRGDGRSAAAGSARAAFAGAIRFQLWQTRRQPGDAQALVLAPLFTVIFIAIMRDAGRDDLLGHAVLAPALITVVGMSLLVAGEIIDQDRFHGALEGVIATPTPLSTVVVGRVLGVTAIGLLGFVESWLAAWLVFGVTVEVAHPWVFAATLLATTVGMASTSTFMAGLFVLARSARVFQNSLSYPLHVLGGVLVPVALLPDWLTVLGRLIYLSWAADLLRDSLHHAPVERVALRLGVVLALSALAFLAGRLMLSRILNRVRRTGAIAHA